MCREKDESPCPHVTATRTRSPEPSYSELLALYRRVRHYCKRERREVRVDSPKMVKDWIAICESVGVKEGGNG